MARLDNTPKRPIGRPRKVLSEAARGSVVPLTGTKGSNRAVSMQAHRSAEILRETVEEVTGTGSRKAKPNRAAPEQADRAVEVLRDTVGQATGTAQQANNVASDATRLGMNAATDMARRMTDQFAGAFSFQGSQGGEFAESAGRSLEAFTQVGSVLTKGAQDLTREWVELTQAGFSKNVENLTALARCRSFPELVAAQTKLVQENVQQMMEGSRRIAERSVQVAGQATQSITAQGGVTGSNGPA